MYNLDMRKKIKIQKDSSFISIYASGELTATQKKIYNALIFFTKEMLREDNERVKFEISMQDLLNCVSEKELNYVHIVENLRALKHIIVEYNVLGKNKKDRIDIFNLIGDVRIENGVIYYDFGFISLEYIKQPQTYAYLDLKIMQGLESKHSISLYEIMQDYKNMQVVDIEFDKFKKAIDIKETEYKRFGDFKDRVIDPSIEEINNKTDLTVRYEKITKGRKVIALKFFVKVKKEVLETNNTLKTRKDFIDWIRAEKVNVVLYKIFDPISEQLMEIACSAKGVLYDKLSSMTYTSKQSDMLWSKLYERFKEDKLEFQIKQTVDNNT